VFTLGLQPYPSVEAFEMAAYLKTGKTLDKPPLCSDEMYGIMPACIIKYMHQNFYISLPDNPVVDLEIFRGGFSFTKMPAKLEVKTKKKKRSSPAF